MNRFPGRSAEPNYANEYAIGGAFNYGGQQQQQQVPPQAKDRELKFDFAPHEQQQQQQQHFQPQAASPAAYSYSYGGGGGYGHYNAAAAYQQQQQVVMGHVGLHSHHQQPHQQQQQQQHQGYGADPLGMLVSSATQPDAMPQQQQQQQQHDPVKGPGVTPKYRGSYGAPPPTQDATFLAGGGGGNQGLQSYGDRQQDNYLKFAQSTVHQQHQQQQHQQQQHMALDVANPHSAAFRSHGMLPSSSYGVATSSSGGGGGGSYPYQNVHHRGSQPSMDLVSPAVTIGMSSSSSSSGGGGYEPSNLGTSSLQRMNNGYSLTTAGGTSGSSSRVPNLFPGSAAALTSRLKDSGGGGGDMLDPRVPTSLGYDPHQQQQVSSAVSKGFGGGGGSAMALYADSSTSPNTVVLSSGADTSSGHSNSGGGGVIYQAPPSSALTGGGGGSSGVSDVVCSLCLGSQCDRVAHACGHRFHSSCLQDWGEKLVCPICRPVRLNTGADHLCGKGFSGC